MSYQDLNKDKADIDKLKVAETKKAKDTLIKAAEDIRKPSSKPEDPMVEDSSVPSVKFKIGQRRPKDEGLLLHGPRSQCPQTYPWPNIPSSVRRDEESQES